MKISKKEILELVSLLGFRSQEGDNNIFLKNYSRHNDYVVKVDFNTEKIEYGNKIKLGDLTTSNFENSENFVVLECVNRILEKGYSPNNIHLEHKWPMGRKEKGKLDILITDKNDKTYLMIECKTWGDEYVKEKRKMQRDGGQLFSYFQQDKSARYLCLYSSRNNEGNIQYANDIVQVSEQWSELSNQKEIFDHWNKNFHDNGIFENWTKPYNIETKALTRERLKELTEEDSGRIFNQFAEILRHNIVSDKPNAFNKIFNLFLCKIVDEDRKAEEELKFQWLESDTDEELQKRLSDLYKQGMKDYLTKDVTDYNDEQVAEKLYALDPEVREQIREMFTRVRLHKNNEFAFKEVFDEKSFRENAIVVREVVELLQPYQIRYGHKQQFLGDFFELLLSTGIKQEAGQFFTPVPIAKFIISSLPIRELIERKISTDETNFLPYIIDYAAGSGHFLTEAMDEIQKIIETLDPDKQKPSVKANIRSWHENSFHWAYDYIYGIEADYRLVKTAKVSCFLNGDGLANVIHADGLDHFQKSIDYKGKLKEISADDTKDNGQFDILVANPPYSVSAFKNTLKNGDESFELFNRLTDDSSEIECLFIERTKQLLKVGGWAGVILPSSILSNSGIYTDAREIILKYFDLKAIAEFGSNTFMATGTNTVTLFLERKPNNDWKKIETAIKNFFDKPKEATVNGIEKAFDKYVSAVFDGLELADYISLVNKTPNENIQKQELYNDYKTWVASLTEIKQLKEKKAFKDKTIAGQQAELDKLFFEKVFAKEQDKMLYYFLVYPQQTVLIKVGEKQDEKDFIGYEFSSRRGHEGIKLYRDENGKPTTKLYDEEDPLNPEKANSYVYRSFLNKKFIIEKSLSENISTFDTLDLIDFSKLAFEKSISLGVKKKVQVQSKYDLIRVKEVSSVITKGTTPTSIGHTFQKSGINFVKIESIDGSGNFIKEKFSYISKACNEDLKRSHLEENDLLISIAGSFGRIGIVTKDILPANTNQAIAIVRVKQDKINLNYLFAILKSNIIKEQTAILIKGVAQFNLSLEQVGNFIIPNPPKPIQEKIIKEISAVEQREKVGREKVEKLNNIIREKYIELRSKANRPYRLFDRDYFDVFIGKRVLKSEIKALGKGIPVYSANVFEPFGVINKSLLESFDRPSLLWGIDGDWMVNVISANHPFYPTDHCGVIRIKKEGLSIYYLATELLEIGKEKNFSRTFRASTERIKDIRILMPDVVDLTGFDNFVKTIYEEINKIESDIANIANDKEQILKKHLE